MDDTCPHCRTDSVEHFIDWGGACYTGLCDECYKKMTEYVNNHTDLSMNVINRLLEWSRI